MDPRSTKSSAYAYLISLQDTEDIEYGVTLVFPGPPGGLELILSHGASNHEATNLYTGYYRVVLDKPHAQELRKIVQDFYKAQEKDFRLRAMTYGGFDGYHYSGDPGFYLFRRVARSQQDYDDTECDELIVDRYGLQWSYRGRKEDNVEWYTGALPLQDFLNLFQNPIPGHGLVIGP